MATTNAVRLKLSPRTPMLPSDALRTQRYLAGAKVDANYPFLPAM